LQPFVPWFRNAHLQTALAHFWPAGLDERRFPVERKLYRTDAEVEVLVESQRPPQPPEGEIVLVHGLESSSRAGYMKSMARAALEAGYAAHRLNLRSCGGTERWSKTAYHSGLTADLLVVLRQLAGQGRGPLYVAGFSLGGTIALKLAGELGEEARGLLAGVAALSTPIDLTESVRRLEEPRNRIYERRFLRRLKNRIRAQHRLRPESFSTDGLNRAGSLREFDELFTSRYFGFSGAAEYYATQSACRFLDAIRVPVLLVQAKDDPVVPFESFERPEALRNRHIELLAVEHGGHLGFVARRGPRFWLGCVVMEWIRGLRD
jgi:uncharacterized protein